MKTPGTTAKAPGSTVEAGPSDGLSAIDSPPERPFETPPDGSVEEPEVAADSVGQSPDDASATAAEDQLLDSDGEREAPVPRLRTQRGLLMAGSIFLFILLAVLVARPSPAGRQRDQVEPPDGPPESSISVKLVTPKPDEFGASSKLPQPSLAPATTVAATTVAPTTTAAPTTVAPTIFPGTVREVASPEQWTAALAAAQPGDTIKLVASIYQPLQYRGSHYAAETRNAVDGTASRPITITAADGVWIDPGNLNNVKPALDIMYTSNVNVVGVHVRNSQFGIRVLQSSGTAQTPIVIANNTVSDIGHAGIHVGGNFDTHEPSNYVRVEGNTITRTGLIAPQYGEGVYIGYGTQEWADRTSWVQVVNNEISYTTAEGVDIKPGAKHILVEGNRIHDLSPIAGGAITASYVGTGPNPNPGESIDIVLRKNRIWNLNLDGRGGSNDWAIWVGHGGVTIDNNAVWGMRGDPGQTRSVRVRATYDFGPFPINITNNVFWTATGWVAEGSPSGAGLVRASGNKGPNDAAGVEVGMNQLTGVPAPGSGGAADSGSGPGSALGL